MFSQELPGADFEIIVVVDGSNDGTAQALRELRRQCLLRVIEQPGKGASSARNKGVQAAEGDILLFVDDDIVCGPNLFQRHLDAHADREPAVVHGSISIDPDTPLSVLKYTTQTWYEDYYGRLEAQEGLRLPEDNFLISNSSMPRATLIECGAFDENMKAKEDYELGLRLWKRGVPFKYLPEARAYEYFQKPIHYVMRSDGAAFGETEILLARKHPGYRRYSRFAAIGKTTWGKRAVRRVLASLPVNSARIFNLPLWICDKFCRFRSMRRMSNYLLGIGRSVVEIRSAVKQLGSWRALESEFGVELPALLYHHVGPAHPGAVPGLTISPKRFERQVRWLARRGYAGIRASDWLGWLREGRSLPEKPVLFTFDDAYTDIAKYALPILRKYGFSATVFVVTGRLGGTNTWDETEGSSTLRLMTAEEIVYWAGQGIEFGAHSRTHAHLTELPTAELTAEVAGSKRDLGALLGSPVISFAYPYGEYNETVREMARNEFDLVFGVEEGLNFLADDPHGIKRAYIGHRDSMFEFALSVRRGGIKSIRDWRIRLGIRSRLKRALRPLTSKRTFA
jgi:peptidoglycan/xylan/chitin deacetylase (PgdA/CDA1 family)/glycosyltransferase involved in cell wall biosynthesis